MRFNAKTQRREDTEASDSNWSPLVRREDFGLRWQSAATTPLFSEPGSIRKGRGAPLPAALQNIWLRLCRAVPLRLCVKATLIWGSALTILGADIPKAPVPKSPYIAVVYRYADTLLDKGRDAYGPQKTGLFLSALDRTTLAPLTNRPPAPGDIRETDRVGTAGGPLVGANPQHDENLLRLLYLVSDLTAKPKYRDAANAALKWFLQNAQSPVTGLLPWGEHLSWDVMADRVITANGDENGTHEFSRPWLLWDRCFEAAPDASRRFALGLWEHQIADRKTGAFDRHAGFAKHLPGAEIDFPRHAGFYIRTWAVAYAQTKDGQFLKAIETLLRRYEMKRHPVTGLMESYNGFTNAWPASALSLAIDCGGAAHLVPEPLAFRLRSFAAREDEVFCALPHDLKSAGGFITSAEVPTGHSNEPPSPLWRVGPGGNTTAQIGMMCVSRYDNAARIGHRHLLLAAADAYLRSMPGDGEDIWPRAFGHAISLQVAAWGHSAKPEYLERARTFADLAIERFFGTNALPRASFKSEHYESITGADTLALALAELHLHVLHHGRALSAKHHRSLNGLGPAGAKYEKAYLEDRCGRVASSPARRTSCPAPGNGSGSESRLQAAAR